MNVGKLKKTKEKLEAIEEILDKAKDNYLNVGKKKRKEKGTKATLEIQMQQAMKELENLKQNPPGRDFYTLSFLVYFTHLFIR